MIARTAGGRAYATRRDGSRSDLHAVGDCVSGAIRDGHLSPSDLADYAFESSVAGNFGHDDAHFRETEISPDAVCEYGFGGYVDGKLRLAQIYRLPGANGNEKYWNHPTAS